MTFNSEIRIVSLPVGRRAERILKVRERTFLLSVSCLMSPSWSRTVRKSFKSLYEFNFSERLSIVFFLLSNANCWPPAIKAVIMVMPTLEMATTIARKKMRLRILSALIMSFLMSGTRLISRAISHCSFLINLLQRQIHKRPA